VNYLDHTKIILLSNEGLTIQEIQARLNGSSATMPKIAKIIAWHERAESDDDCLIVESIINFNFALR